MAREPLHWDRPFHTVRSGCFRDGDVAWFPEGYLNACYNCVDRWAYQDPDKKTFHLCIVNLVIGTLYCAKQVSIYNAT